MNNDFTLHDHASGFSGEHRQCYVWPFSGGAQQERLRAARETAASGSGFLAEVAMEAQKVPEAQRKGRWAADLADEAKWRETWADPQTFLSDQDPTATIDDPAPQTFLWRFTKEARKEMLLRYLKERFPTYAKAGDVDYDKVVATNVSTLVDPSPALDAFRGAVRAFLYMGAKMRGEDLDPLTQADAAVTGRAGGPDGLDVAVKTELEKRYANPTTLSEDFLRTLRRHPEIGIATLSNVDAVRTALQADRSMLGTAITQGVIDNAKLAPLCANAATNLTRRQQVVQGAAGREAEIRNQIETQQERGFVTKLAENFSNLDTWQKWVIGIVGGYLAYKFITRKREHGLDLWDAAVGLPVILYVFNGRKLLDGTIFGNLLNYPEGFVNDLGNKLNRGTGVTAQMNPERVRMYGQFFAEVARVEVKDELEAIEYLSSIAIGSVANSLTLSTNAMVGELNVRDTSPLVREIRRIYGEEVGDRILSKVRRMRTGLGTALPRVFYLLGGTDRPSDFHRIEDARRATPNQKYEELPDAEKQAYKQLVLHGQNLALTTYQGMSLYEVVGILLQKNA